MIMNSKLFVIKRLLQHVRQFHFSHLKNCTYEGSGKTTLHFINFDVGPRILIDKCSTWGFNFIDKSVILGPLVIFPKTIFCWNVASARDINEKTLSLFTVLEPKLDIIVLGLETKYEYKQILDMKKLLTEKNISVEILPVQQACGVYNFLCDEGRYVAAGLIPPLPEETVPYKKLKSAMETIQNRNVIESD